MNVHGYVDRLDVLPAGFAGPVVPSGAALLVTGWALHDGRSANDVQVVVRGGPAFRAARGLHRPDVAAVFGAQASGAGFQAYVPTAPLGLGTHFVRVLADGVPLRDELPLTVAAAGPSLAGADLAPVNALIDEALIGGRDLPGSLTPGPAGPADTIVVRGWVDADGEAEPFRAVLGIVDETTVFVGLAGLPRPDVAAFFGDPARLACGFRLHLPLRHLGPGAHHLRLAFGLLPQHPLGSAAQTIPFAIVA